MFKFLRGLIARITGHADKHLAVPKTDSPNPEDFARLNSQVPLKNADDAHNAFVRREAILNCAEKIAGYEFSLLTSLQARKYRGSGATKQAYDAALLARLALHGVASLLGRRLAFINLSIESLSSALISQLPPKNTVLILDATEQTTHSEDLLARLAELKERGFAFGLRLFGATDTTSPLIAGAEYLQIDVTAFDGLDLRTLTRNLKKLPSAGGQPPQLLARNVQSFDDFQFCTKCGFDFFQGQFISSRENFHSPSGGINRMVVLHIVSMVLSEQSFASIANQLKNEPTLTYKLLRYINSAAMGLQKNIDSLTEALILLGREKFSRWTSLLLFDFSSPTYQERSLAERALTRGRTLELIAGKGRIPNDRGHLFLIGLFSLLDVALGLPLPKLLEKAVLPTVVRDTLLGKASAYADALALVILGEADASTLPEQMARALERCGIDDSCYTLAATEALVWTDQTLSDVA